MAHVFVDFSRSLPVGRLAQHLVQALVVTLIAVSIVTEANAAKSSTYTTGGSQNGFIAACRGEGGTTKRLETYVVQCTLPNGYVIVCNFGTGICKDFPPESITSSSPGTLDTRTVSGSRSAVLPSGVHPFLPTHLAATSRIL